MVRLLRPESFTRSADVARDLTPDSSGPAFNLTQQREWREEIEPFLDGKPHTYRIEMRWQSLDRENAEPIDGPVEELRFSSSAHGWDEFKRDYYEVVRHFISIQRQRNAVRRMIESKEKPKRRGAEK